MLLLVYESADTLGMPVELAETLADLSRGVEKAIDHVAHLLHAVLDVLLRVFGEGHAAIPDQTP